jgi:putative salt-induced outer membrane protein YdiY
MAECRRPRVPALWVGLLLASLGTVTTDAQEAGDVAGPALEQPPAMAGSLRRLPPINDYEWEHAEVPVTEELALPEEDDPEAIPAPEAELAADVPMDIEPITPKLWQGSFEFGLSGSDGNSQTFDMRVGANGKYANQRREITLDLNYAKSAADQVETQNEMLFDGRHERLFKDSDWTLYVHNTVLFDEFAAFDSRITADAGLGYTWIEHDRTTLRSRLGGGASYEINSPQDYVVPEAIFGFDLSHQLTPRQKLTAKSEYFPDVTDFNNFRINSKAGWEILVDPTWNLNLQLAIFDRYDSTPNGAKHNDLDYSMLLIWKF